MFLIIIKFARSYISLKDLFFLGDNKQFGNLKEKRHRNNYKDTTRNLQEKTGRGG